MSAPIEILAGSPVESDLADLIALLRDAVEGGASVGFMLPANERKLEAFWRGVFADVAAGAAAP